MPKKQLKIDRNATDSGGSADGKDEESGGVPAREKDKHPDDDILARSETPKEVKTEILSDTEENPQKEDGLIDFVAQKAQNISAPFNLTQLAEEYMTSEGIERSTGYIRIKIVRLRDIIPEIMRYDGETKVKMLFGLGAAIREDYLEELRKEALVEVDDKNRVIKYESNDGSLKLEGSHSIAARYSRGRTVVKKKEEKEKETLEGSDDGGSVIMTRQQRRLQESKALIPIVLKTEIISDAEEENPQEETHMDNFKNESLPRKDNDSDDDGSVIMTRQQQRIRRQKANGAAIPRELKTEIMSDTEENPQDVSDSDNTSNRTHKKKELFDFLIQKCHAVSAPLNLAQLCREYNEQPGALRTFHGCFSSICRLRNKISTMSDIDPEMKVKMLFGLSVPLENTFLEKLRKEALVELDGKNRIINYKANDGSLELEGNHSYSTKIPRPRLNNDDFISFIVHNAQNITAPFIIKQLCRKYQKETGAQESINCLYKRMMNFRIRIPEMEDMDKGTKVRMMFGLSASVAEDFLEELRKEALVEVDDRNRIINYKANDGSLHLEGKHSSVAKRSLDYRRREEESDDSDTPPEDDRSEMHSIASDAPKTDAGGADLFEFLVQKCQSITAPLTMTQFAHEYKEQTGATESARCFELRISRMRNRIQKMKEVDEKTTVRMLFGLSASVGDDFLEKLRENALVEVDDKNRITKYRANDGSLELEGNHRISAKGRRMSKRAQIPIVLKTEVMSDVKIDRNATDSGSSSGDEEGEISPGTLTRQQRRLQKSKAQIPKALKTEILSETYSDSDDDREDGMEEKRGVVPRSQRSAMYPRVLKTEIMDLDLDLNPPTGNGIVLNPERKALFDFLIQKCQETRAPLNIRQLSRDYKLQINEERNEETIRKKIRLFRLKIQKMEGIDEKTRVKMLFGLGVSIGYAHLEELRKDAFVELDEQNRIIVYEANDGSLYLEGDHSSSLKSQASIQKRKEERRARRTHLENPQEAAAKEQRKYSEDKILETPKKMVLEEAGSPDAGSLSPRIRNLFDFLAKKAQNTLISPWIISQLLNEYKDQTGAPETTGTLESRIRRLRDKIPEMKDLDEETKVKMLFGLGVSVGEECLKELQNKGFVVTDDKNRIIEYESNDGSLYLQGEHSLTERRKAAVQHNFDDDDDRERTPQELYGFSDDFEEEASVILTRQQWRLRESSRAQMSRKLKTEIVDTDFDDFGNSSQRAPESERRATWSDDTDDFEAENPRETPSIRKSHSQKETLFNFLVRKCENNSTPLNITQLARNYKQETGEEQSERAVHMRIIRLREKIAAMNDFDRDKKVKILFGLSASISESLLKKLQESAHVKLDSNNRIAKYRANDGSLKLEGDHSFSAKYSAIYEHMKTETSRRLHDSDDEFSAIFDFVVRKSRDITAPLNISQLAREYKEVTGAGEKIECLVWRITSFRRRVPKMKDVDEGTKVKILFGLSAQIDMDYLRKLRKSALVKVDDRNRIIKYRANDGSLELEGDHNIQIKIQETLARLKKELVTLDDADDSDGKDDGGDGDVAESEHGSTWSDYSEAENPLGKTADPMNLEEDPSIEKFQTPGDDLLGFLIRKCENTTTPLNKSQLARDYKLETGEQQSERAVHMRITRLREKIAAMNDFNRETKVKMLFGLRVSIDESFLKKLQKSAQVKLDYKNRIVEYKANDGSLELKGDHSCSEVRESVRNFKNTSEENIFNFVVAKSRDITSPLNISQLCREYIELTGGGQNMDNIFYRIKTIRHRIPGMKDIEEETKVRMLFGLSAQIEEPYLKELRKTALVKVDDRNRIIKYKTKNGSFELEGDHNISIKVEETKARKKKERVTLDDDDDSDGKDDGGDGDVDVIAVKNSRRVLPQRISTTPRSRRSPLRRSTRLSAPLIAAPKRELICGEDELIRSAPPRKRYRIKNYMQTIDSLTQQLKESSGRIGGGGGVTVKTEPFDEEEDGIVETRNIHSELFKARRIIKQEVVDFDYETVSPIPMRNDHSEEIQIDISPLKSPATFDFITGPQAIIDFRAESSAHAPEGAPVPSQMMSLASTNRLKMSPEKEPVEVSTGGKDEPTPSLSVENPSEATQMVSIREKNEQKGALSAPKEQLEPRVEVKPEIFHVPKGTATSSDMRGEPKEPAKEPEPRVEVKPEVLLIPNAKTPTTRLISVSDHIRFLEAIHTTIISMDIPILKELQQRIETRIHKIQLEGNRGENVVMSELNAAVVTCLQMIHKSMGMREESSEEIGRSSLREFLLILRTSIVGLKLPILQQSERKIKKMMAELATGGDKKFPIDKIAFGLQTILDFIAP